MKLKDLLLILGISFISIGVGSFIAAFILFEKNLSGIGDILLGVASICGVLALVALIFRLIKTTETIAPNNSAPKVVVKIVDVKDVPKTKEEQLFDQYEDLYKQGLITKEDLELKRKELLQK